MSRTRAAARWAFDRDAYVSPETAKDPAVGASAPAVHAARFFDDVVSQPSRPIPQMTATRSAEFKPETAERTQQLISSVCA